MEFIDLKSQYQLLKQQIDSGISKVLEHGQFIMGPEIKELETSLSGFVGVKHCISVSSGTTSLEIALRALNVGPNDEVITVPFTWISSAETINLVGAKPVFVDIELDTYNIDVEQIEAAVTPATKAIVPVSLFGQMPKMERLNEIAVKYGIPVIEDAAQSFGATRYGKLSCAVSTISSTSFFPAKPLGCYGDGGALFTDDEELANRMRAIRTHGGTARHHHTLVGTNGRMDTMQAAIVLAKLPSFPSEVKRRGEIGALYSELLKDDCVTPLIDEGNTHVYAQYTIRVPNRDALGTALKSEGIPTAVYYPKCLHEQPVYEYLGYRWRDFPNCELASREVISLPMHPFLTDEDVKKIASSVKSSLRTLQVS